MPKPPVIPPTASIIPTTIPSITALRESRE
jgi:hypothetical protein